MRLATVILLATLAVLQYSLWLGKGGWLRIWSLERDIEAQAVRQSQLRGSNTVGRADVEDLRSGLDAIEERARREIGMVRPEETFFQYPQPPGDLGSMDPQFGPGQGAGATTSKSTVSASGPGQRRRGDEKTD
jgi:cell division protein FtsB